VGQIVENFQKNLMKPNFYLDEAVQSHIREAESKNLEDMNTKVNLIMSCYQKIKTDKPEAKSILYKFSQPTEDRINSDAQNKKITNKFMN